MSGLLGARTSYTFEHEAVVPHGREALRERLLDLEHYPQWWPQVRAVARIDDDNALVVCRSVLPYDLELHLHAVRRDPDLLEVAVDGPLRGRVRWRLHEQGPGRTRMRFEQQVQVRGPMLTLASLLARPVLRWNHAVMMRGAQAGLVSMALPDAGGRGPVS